MYSYRILKDGLYIADLHISNNDPLWSIINENDIKLTTQTMIVNYLIDKPLHKALIVDNSVFTFEIIP